MWNHGGALWAQFQRPHSVEEYCKTQIFKIKKKQEKKKEKKNKRSARPCRSHWLQHPDLGEADVTRELSILPKIDKEKKTQPHLWTHDNRSATFASWLYRVHSLRSQAPCFCFFPTLFYEAVTFVRNEAEYAAHPAAVDAGVLRHDAGDRAH